MLLPLFYYTAAHTADFCTHTIQVTQIQQSRFTRRILEVVKPLRTNCGKYSIFGCSDAWKIKMYVSADNLISTAFYIAKVLPEYRHRVLAKLLNANQSALNQSDNRQAYFHNRFLHLEIIAPKNMIEERISRIKSSHILQSHIPLVSTVTVLPALCTLQPNLSSTKSVLSTSRRYGQFFKVHTPSA